MNILWVSDEPNWAYDINAKALSAQMPMHKHHFIYSCQQGKEGVDAVYNEMDIIVAMNPAGFYMYRSFEKVISILDTVRAIGDSNKKLFSKVAGIICNNNYLFEYAKKRNGNVMLQPNGLDLNVFKPIERSGKFTIGFAGNITGPYAGYKGWNLYREAVALFLDVEQVSVLYGQSRITPDRMVPDFYHKIDCLILPSVNEGCSNVITEALACGVPVICTKIGYHGEALEDGKQCLFVKRNVDSIRQAIDVMQTGYKVMKKEARLFACQNHDIKKVAARYEQFFQEINHA